MSLTAIRDTRTEEPGIGGFEMVGPNWFASVMGTGIVAVAAATLPFEVPGLAVVATAVWALAATLLVAVCVATAMHWVRHPDVARSHLDHPVMGHFYGAPAMALMTVGAGALLVGHRIIGLQAAVVLDGVLWVAGTTLGLATTIVVPWRMVRTRAYTADRAFGGWLMPVVPPMVSAATGTALVPHLPTAGLRAAMLIICLGCFALALGCSALMIPMIARRLLRHGVGPAAAVPTLWIVLGPIGQSITAAHHLGQMAPDVLPGPAGTVLHGLVLPFAEPMWVLAVVWLAIAATLTLRTARTGMPFGLPWWSFTFPVGTVVTGTSGLAEFTGSPVICVAAGMLFVVLVAAWVVVATRTAAAVRSRAI